MERAWSIAGVLVAGHPWSGFNRHMSVRPAAGNYFLFSFAHLAACNARDVNKQCSLITAFSAQILMTGVNVGEHAASQTRLSVIPLAEMLQSVGSDDDSIPSLPLAAPARAVFSVNFFISSPSICMNLSCA